MILVVLAIAIWWSALMARYCCPVEKFSRYASPLSDDDTSSVGGWMLGMAGVGLGVATVIVGSGMLTSPPTPQPASVSSRPTNATQRQRMGAICRRRRIVLEVVPPCARISLPAFTSPTPLHRRTCMHLHASACI